MPDSSLETDNIEPDRNRSGHRSACRAWRARSARRSSGTTSSSTTLRPRWFSRTCSFRSRARTRVRCSPSRPTAVGFAARPVGAAIFGHWGDRIGRKTTLIITLLVMGISSAIVGILPGTASIGMAAPLILVLLRLVQGIAIGGEWSGSVLLAMEWGDQDKRGLLGSAAQIGVPVGLVLGTGGMTLLSATLSPEAFNSWGWRVPFLASLILVAVGLVIRLKILETPMFARVLAEGKTAQHPGAWTRSGSTGGRSCSRRARGSASRCRSTCSRPSC